MQPKLGNKSRSFWASGYPAGSGVLTHTRVISVTLLLVSEAVVSFLVALISTEELKPQRILREEMS